MVVLDKKMLSYLYLKEAKIIEETNKKKREFLNKSSFL